MKHKDIPILLYFDVGNYSTDNFAVLLSEFEKQMNYLRKNDFAAISISELGDFVEGKKELPEKSVAIAFINFGKGFLKAIPILQKNDFKAELFVATELVGEESLTWDEINGIKNQGFKIGCAGKKYDEINYADGADEAVTEAKKLIENKLGIEINDFIYKNTDINQEVIKKIKPSFLNTVSGRELNNNGFLTRYDLSRRLITKDCYLGKFIKILNPPTVSFCMIARNEEQLVESCLNSIKAISDEIIVVDTGSNDRTKEICSKFDAKIIDFTWSDDFSEARNTYLKNAKGDWILTLDADEFIDRESLVFIKKLSEMDFDALTFEVRTYSNNENDLNWKQPDEPKKIGEKNYTGYIPLPRVRFFRNFKGYYYKNAVHETIDDSLERKKAKVGDVDIIIHHCEDIKGHEEIKKKQIIYVEYSKKRIEENPNDVKAYCDIALVKFKFLDEFEEAEQNLLKALEINPNYARAYFLLGELYVLQKKFADATALYEKILLISNDEKENENAKANIARIKQFLLSQPIA
ncbi:MAG TPA: glycosyltransferase [Candidatus Nanoarchaeia archaeon]|nr:glycosyltransferase [Candidatus Nanoarchaeia archaeon]